MVSLPRTGKAKTYTTASKGGHLSAAVVVPPSTARTRAWDDFYHLAHVATEACAVSVSRTSRSRVAPPCRGAGQAGSTQATAGGRWPIGDLLSAAFDHRAARLLSRRGPRCRDRRCAKRRPCPAVAGRRQRRGGGRHL